MIFLYKKQIHMTLPYEKLIMCICKIMENNADRPVFSKKMLHTLRLCAKS